MVESLVFEGEAFVIDAKAMERGGSEVTDVHRIFDDVVAEVIGLAMHAATGDAATGHPHAEAAAVVVAPGVELALTVYTAAEFAAPDDEGVVEHTALLEVGHQSGGGLVGVLALGGHVRDE